MRCRNGHGTAHAKRCGIVRGCESQSCVPADPNLATVFERLRGARRGSLANDAHAVRRCAPWATRTRSPSGSVAPRQLPIWTDEVAGVAVRIAFQVILVLG